MEVADMVVGETELITLPMISEQAARSAAARR